MRLSTVGILAAGLATQQVVATGWSTDAFPFSCPSNTNNNCTDTQKSGYDWSGLKPGSFDSYGNNKFSGWSCSNSFGKRDSVTKRTFQNKCITGGLHNHPSISCHDNDAMSIEHMQVSSTHDTDLECHYGMPDGSTCKEYHSCRSGGSILQNTQCGGATSVTFKPGQNSPPDCSIGVHSVGFNCGTASSTVPYTSTPTAYQSTSVSVAETTPTAYQSTSEIVSTSGIVSSTVPIESGTSSSAVSAVSSTSAESSTTPVESSTAPVESSTTPVETSSAPVYSIVTSTTGVPYSNVSTGTVASSTPVVTPSSSSEVSPVSSTSPSSYASTPTTTPASTESTPVASSTSEGSPASSTTPVEYTTSTVYSTTVATTTSCAGGATTCNEQSTVYITSTIAVSTTVCPVTAAETSSSAVSPASSSPASSYATPTAYPSSSAVSPGSSSAPVYSSSSEVSPASSSPAPYPSSSEVSPVSSTATGPSSYPSPNAPGVLPKCLNTWMFETGCKDNTDSSCYCKDEQFVKHVMGCIGSWSSSNSDTSDAASYFMGICAPYIGQNPAIITACPSTTPVGSSSTVDAASTAAPTTATITRYSTTMVTMTSCAPDVTNCPVSSTAIVMSSVPIETTVVVQTAPITAAPATTAASTPVGPVTTIVYSSTVVVPCTYSTGVSAGYTIPSSSTTSQLVTTVTVPQVQFTTATVTQAGATSTVSVGLGNGTPPPYSAGSTAAPVSTAVPTTYGTIGTSYTSSTPSATSSPIPYANAGFKLSGSGVAGVVFGAVAAFLTL